ncbi:MAG: hypothetical protein N2234_00765 [Planctomycetota bacterium]|nr:hypothetical protein [Planctomycetota bacterium]
MQSVRSFILFFSSVWFATLFCVSAEAGHWETKEVRIWVPGHYEKVWVPDEYQDVFINGKLVRIKIRNGYWKVVWVPGHWRVEYVQVWVED